MSLTQSDINKNTHDIDLFSFYMRFCIGDLIKGCQSVRRSIRLIHTNFQSENGKKKKVFDLYIRKIKQKQCSRHSNEPASIEETTD